MKIRCIFGSLQVLTFCLLDIVCLRVLSISLGGVHREVLQQQEEETDCSASLQGWSHLLTDAWLGP